MFINDGRGSIENEFRRWREMEREIEIEGESDDVPFLWARYLYV